MFIWVIFLESAFLVALCGAVLGLIRWKDRKKRLPFTQKILRPPGESLRLRLIDFQREKCDLSLVIVPVIEKSIVPNAVPGHALNRFHFDQRIVVRFATVMPKEIMAARDVKMADFHRDQ